jgi:hypothetical protein
MGPVAARVTDCPLKMGPLEWNPTDGRSYAPQSIGTNHSNP